MNQKAHCQICEREVKQPHGLTSHHGYSRPGYGWQTASCQGARELPYEESCALIPPVIEGIKGYIARLKNEREVYMTKPPKVLTKTHKNIYSGTEETEEFDRPDDFDSYAIIDRDEPFSYYDNYRKYFKQAIYEIDRNMKWAQEDVERLQRRVDNWVKVR